MSNQKRCPQCGLVNFADAEVCKRCGASFDGATQTGPAPRKASNLLPCSECEHLVSTTALSCPNCGGIFKHPAEASQPKREASETTKSIEAAICFLVALIFALAALWNMYYPTSIVGGDA